MASNPTIPTMVTVFCKGILNGVFVDRCAVVRSGLRSENRIIEGCATLFESHVDTRGEVENLAC